MRYALSIMHFSLCIFHYALCIMHFVLGQSNVKIGRDNIDNDLEYKKRKCELQLQIQEHEAKLERLDEELRKQKLLKVAEKLTNRMVRQSLRRMSQVSLESMMMINLYEQLISNE